MTTPYQLDPEQLLAKTRQAAEDRHITLDNGPVRLPPTIGPDQALGLLGPFVGQPASSQKTFEHSHHSISWATRIMLGAIATIAAIALFKLFNN